jgi:hypothetical protein
MLRVKKKAGGCRQERRTCLHCKKKMPAGALQGK